MDLRQQPRRIAGEKVDDRAQDLRLVLEMAVDGGVAEADPWRRCS